MYQLWGGRVRLDFYINIGFPSQCLCTPSYASAWKCIKAYYIVVSCHIGLLSLFCELWLAENYTLKKKEEEKKETSMYMFRKI